MRTPALTATFRPWEDTHEPAIATHNLSPSLASASGYDTTSLSHTNTHTITPPQDHVYDPNLVHTAIFKHHDAPLVPRHHAQHHFSKLEDHQTDPEHTVHYNYENDSVYSTNSTDQSDYSKWVPYAHEMQNPSQNPTGHVHNHQSPWNTLSRDGWTDHEVQLNKSKRAKSTSGFEMSAASRMVINPTTCGDVTADNGRFTDRCDDAASRRRFSFDEHYSMAMTHADDMLVGRRLSEQSPLYGINGHGPNESFFTGQAQADVAESPNEQTEYSDYDVERDYYNSTRRAPNTLCRASSAPTVSVSAAKFAEHSGGVDNSPRMYQQQALGEMEPPHTPSPNTVGYRTTPTQSPMPPRHHSLTQQQAQNGENQSPQRDTDTTNTNNENQSIRQGNTHTNPAENVDAFGSLNPLIPGGYHGLSGRPSNHSKRTETKEQFAAFVLRHRVLDHYDHNNRPVYRLTLPIRRVQDEHVISLHGQFNKEQQEHSTPDAPRQTISSGTAQAWLRATFSDTLSHSAPRPHTTQLLNAAKSLWGELYGCEKPSVNSRKNSKSDTMLASRPIKLSGNMDSEYRVNTLLTPRSSAGESAQSLHSPYGSYSKQQPPTNPRMPPRNRSSPALSSSRYGFLYRAASGDFESNYSAASDRTDYAMNLETSMDRLTLQGNAPGSMSQYRGKQSANMIPRRESYGSPPSSIAPSPQFTRGYSDMQSPGARRYRMYQGEVGVEEGVSEDGVGYEGKMPRRRSSEPQQYNGRRFYPQGPY